MTYTPTYLRLSHRFDGALLDGICQRVGASALVRLERVLVIRLYGGSEEEQTSNYAEDVQLLARICAHHWCPLDAWHRFQVCARLAEHLAAHWAEDRHLMVLDAYIELSRELLHIDYPDRALARAHLAHLLLTHFHMTEENSSLEEAILLERDTLALRQPGHPDRGISCGNLAVALTTRFLQTRDSALLDQIIVLEREALELNPDRARSCTNLASSLRRRFEQTGERAVLDEAIILQREGMDLRPIGHPHRSVSCGSLAISLKLRFELETKPNIVLLNEAIKLERETVGLCPTGHPDRAVCCANLADSLTRLLDEAEDQALLDEAIRLEREVLELRPAGHPGRAIACLNLAASLKRRLGTIASGASADPIALMEASELLREALVHHPMGHPGRWRCLDELAQLAILHYNGAVAIMHLQEILASPVYDDINTVVKSVVDMIGRIDVETVSHQQRQELLGAYSDAIGLVSLAASFAVSRASQLQHIHHGRTLGSEAYLLAIRVDDLPTGLQLLERARGVIWSQIIHMRDPQLDDVPQELAERLQRLISGVATPASAQFPDITLSPTSGSIYTQRREVQDVIRQIRSLPGLDDFMRGPDAGTLLTTATQNPVVVLIAGETECHALVLPSAGGPLVNIVLPHVNRKALQALNFFGRTAQNRGSTFDGQEAIRLGLVTAPMKSHVASYDCLAKLWRTVVKPVITHLGLSVSKGCIHRERSNSWAPAESARPRPTSHPLVSYGRVRVRAYPRSRGILRRKSRMLRGLPRVFVYANTRRALARTGGPAGVRPRADQAPSDRSRICW
jgi:hypothetical protein